MYKYITFSILTLFTFSHLFATTHIVSSQADAGPGSLRNTVIGASSGDTIMISYFQGDSIKLTSGMIEINFPLHILGQGKDSTVISGNSNSRIFKVNNTGSLYLYDLTIADGYEVVVGFDGAGIYCTGDLFLKNCNINSCYTNGFTSTEGKGGAIFFESGGGKKLILDNVSILDNYAKELGGGIYIKASSGDTIKIHQTEIVANATHGEGGAVYADLNSGSNIFFEALDVRTIGNSGSMIGAIKLEINNNNKFIYSGGEIRGNSSDGFINAAVIDIHAKNISTVLFERLSIAYNSATLGGKATINIKAENTSQIDIHNSFITTNYGIVGLYLEASAAAIVNSFENTFADQRSLFFDPTHNIKVDQGTLYIRNNLITNGPDSIAQNNILPGNGSIISLGYNLISNDSAGVVVSQPTDMIGSPGAVIDPKIGLAQDNGGGVITNALMCGSPAVDAGGPVFSGSLDVRGFNRSIGGAIDIGAYERQILSDTIPVADFTFSMDTICQFELFTAFNQSLASTGSTYQWYRDTLPAGNSSYSYNSVIFMQDSLAISLVVTTPACYTDSITKYIYSPIFSPLPAQAPASVQICQNDSVIITLNPTSSAYLYQLTDPQGIIDTTPHPGNGGALNISTGPLQMPTTVKVIMKETNYGCTKYLDETTQIGVLEVHYPTITRTGEKLIANMQYVTGYQWYLDGDPVVGGIDDTLLMTQNGTYHVEGTNVHGCVGASAPLVVTNIGIENKDARDLTIFPNPASDKIFIKNTQLTGPAIISINDNTGRVIEKKEILFAGNSMELDISDFTPGFYIISIVHENAISNYKIYIFGE